MNKTNTPIPWDLSVPSCHLVNHRARVQCFPRHLLKLKLFIFQERTQATFEMETLNVSLGGVFLATAHLPQLEDVFRLRFDLPHGSCASVAEVVHLRDERKSARQYLPQGFGLSFRSCPPRTFAMLKSHLDEVGQREGAEWSLLPAPL